MKRIDFLLTEYCEHLVNIMHRCGFSGVNIIEKILKDPGIATGGSKHRILWWPKNKRIGRMSRAFHQISTEAQVFLVIEYGRIVQSHNGQILTPAIFCAKRGISRTYFDHKVSGTSIKLRYILKGYDHEAEKNKDSP